MMKKKRMILFFGIMTGVILLGMLILTVSGKINRNTQTMQQSVSAEFSDGTDDKQNINETGNEENGIASSNEVPVVDLFGEEDLSSEEDKTETVFLSPYDEKEAETLTVLYEKVSENRVTVLETAEEGVVTMTFAGDILFDKNYAIYSSFLQRGGEIEKSLSEPLLEKMRAADIMMVNNEFPYTDRGEPTPDKTYTFRAPTDSVRVLFDMGVDIVSLANNHASDYGQISLLDSLETLENAGMPYVGAGRNLEEAMQPYYFESDGYVIAVVSATQIERYATPSTPGATESTPGVFRCYDPTLAIECIKEAKENSDFVVLYVHWGTESTDQLDWAQNSQAPQYAEAGADLIIGDHPHVLQEIGYIGEVPVVYSLGNFWFNSRTLDTCMVTATIREGKLESLQFIPCLQSGCSTSLLENTEKMRVINYMRSISDTALIDDEGFISPK